MRLSDAFSFFFALTLLQCFLPGTSKASERISTDFSVETATGIGERDSAQLAIAPNGDLIVITIKDNGMTTLVSRHDSSGKLLSGPGPVKFDSLFPANSDSHYISKILPYGNQFYLYGTFGFDQVVNGTNYGTYGSFIARMNGDGSFDRAFGGTGLITITGGFSGSIANVVLTPDDKLLVETLKQDKPTDNTSVHEIAVLKSSGDQEGVVNVTNAISQVVQSKKVDVAFMALGANGDLVLAGADGDFWGTPTVCAVSLAGGSNRCTSASTFSSGIKDPGRIVKLKALSDGSYVAIASVVNNHAKYGSGNNFVVLKLTSDFKPDVTFNHTGYAQPIIADSCFTTGGRDIGVEGLWVTEKSKRITADIFRCLTGVNRDNDVRTTFTRFDFAGSTDLNFSDRGSFYPSRRNVGKIIAAESDDEGRLVTLSTLPYEPGQSNNMILSRFEN